MSSAGDQAKRVLRGDEWKLIRQNLCDAHRRVAGILCISDSHIRFVRRLCVPRGVTEIPENFGAMAKSLREIDFEVGSKITRIRNETFAYTKLENILVPANVEVIEDQAFTGAESMYGITFFPNSKLLSIGKYAFYGARLRCVYLPRHVRKLSPVTFIGCEISELGINCMNENFVSQDHMILDKTQKKVIYCYGKRPLVIIRPSIEEIGRLAFYGCSSEEVHVTNNVKSIATDSFLQCPNLISLDIRSPALRHKYFGAPFQGIIANLERDCGGNVHDMGIVNVTTSSVMFGHPHLVTSRCWTGYWSSKNIQNSWIQFDFKDNGVRLSHYSMRCGLSRYPTKWEVTGSNDANTWTVLDTREGGDELWEGVHKVFTCNSHESALFQFIRITQTGQNKSGRDRDKLYLSEVEFFGDLVVCSYSSD